MGANGSKASGILEIEEERRYKTTEVLKNGVKMIEFKNGGTKTKMPEESHSPNSIYGMMYRKGNGLKAISIYDENCKKIVEIHTADHNGIGMHYHKWKDGAPVGDPIPIASNS